MNPYGKYCDPVQDMHDIWAIKSHTKKVEAVLKVIKEAANTGDESHIIYGEAVLYALKMWQRKRIKIDWTGTWRNAYDRFLDYFHEYHNWPESKGLGGYLPEERILQDRASTLADLYHSIYMAAKKIQDRREIP